MNKRELREAFVKLSGRYNFVGTKTVSGENMPDYDVDAGADFYVNAALKLLSQEVLSTRNEKHFIRTATADFPGVAIPNIIAVSQVAVNDIPLHMALERDLLRRLSAATDTGTPTHWLEAHEVTFTEPLPVPENAIEISTIDELQLIGFDDDYPVDGNYILTQDIDASDTASWDGGKGFASSIYDFSGILDGQGYTITNLTIDRPTTPGGLFRTITGTIQNLNIEGTVTILYGGPFAAVVEGTITNCRFTGSVTTASAVLQCGGICGQLGADAEATYLHCYGTITGAGTYTGGIVGVAAKTQNISCCKFVGSVTGTKWVGGIVGYVSGQYYIPTIRLSNCKARATLVATSPDFNYVGGIAGELEYGRILNCLAISTITAEEDGETDTYVGGIVGLLYRDIGIPQADRSLVINSYYDSDVSGLEDTDRGTPKTTEELYTLSTYEDWDFSSIWVSSDGYNYPDLMELVDSLDETTILLYPYPIVDTLVHVSCWTYDPLVEDTDESWWSINYFEYVTELAYSILSAGEMNGDRRIIDAVVERAKVAIHKQDIRDEVNHLGARIHAHS